MILHFDVGSVFSSFFAKGNQTGNKHMPLLKVSLTHPHFGDHRSLFRLRWRCGWEKRFIGGGRRFAINIYEEHLLIWLISEQRFFWENRSEDFTSVSLRFSFLLISKKRRLETIASATLQRDQKHKVLLTGRKLSVYRFLRPALKSEIRKGCRLQRNRCTWFSRSSVGSRWELEASRLAITKGLKWVVCVGKR